MTISVIKSICPENDLIKPCFCEDNSIYCTGNYGFDLENIFNSLSKSLSKPSKYFEKFLLSNTAIKELKENTFKDINFGEIFIGSCDNLSLIDKNAFKGTDLFTTRLEISESPALSSPDNSIFEALAKFVKIEKISLSNVNITEIPSKAFKPLNGYQNNLRELYFTGKSFTKLGSKAFSQINNLKILSFEQVTFQQIPDKAFSFESGSNFTLILSFAANERINSSVFAENSLIDIKRPTKLILGSPRYPHKITYLDEKVFLPFLLDKSLNSIDLLGESFDCSDCRNYWIKKNSTISSQITHLNCSNGKDLNDQDNFSSCHL